MSNSSAVGNSSRHSLIASIGSGQSSSQSLSTSLNVQQSSAAPETLRSEGREVSVGKQRLTQALKIMKQALTKSKSEKTEEQSTSNKATSANAAKTSHTSGESASSPSVSSPSLPTTGTPFQLSVEERRKLFDGTTASSSSLALKPKVLVPITSKRVTSMAAMFEKGSSANEPISEPSTPAKPNKSKVAQLAQQYTDVAASKPSEPSPSNFEPAAVSEPAYSVDDLLEDLELELATVVDVLKDLKQKEEAACAEGKSDDAVLIRDTKVQFELRKTNLESRLKKLEQNKK